MASYHVTDVIACMFCRVMRSSSLKFARSKYFSLFFIIQLLAHCNTTVNNARNHEVGSYDVINHDILHMRTANPTACYIKAYYTSDNRDP